MLKILIYDTTKQYKENFGIIYFEIIQFLIVILKWMHSMWYRSRLCSQRNKIKKLFEKMLGRCFLI